MVTAGISALPLRLEFEARGEFVVAWLTSTEGTPPTELATVRKSLIECDEDFAIWRDLVKGLLAMQLQQIMTDKAIGFIETKKGARS